MKTVERLASFPVPVSWSARQVGLTHVTGEEVLRHVKTRALVP